MTNYDIGYKKPPLATQFKKGQSGNPKGRPKGAVNLLSVFRKALSERVSVQVNGRHKSITKLEAAVTQVVNKAAGGDLKAMNLLSQWSALLATEDGSRPQVLDSQADHKIMEDLLKRMQDTVADESRTKVDGENHHG